MNTIHYPGNHGQRCQATYGITSSSMKETSIFPRTHVLFVENKEGNPGGTFCNNGTTPNFLVNKVFNNDLEGCRPDLVDVYYAGLPDSNGRRDVYHWPVEIVTEDPSQFEKPDKRTLWDRFKQLFKLNTHPSSTSVKSADSAGGMRRIRVDERNHSILSEEERITMLQKFGVLSR